MEVSGWVQLLAPVDLDNVHPDPHKWDIKRPHPTMMVLVNREDGFKVMVTPHSIRGRFNADENPSTHKIPQYLRHVAADELGVNDRRLKLDPRKFTLWNCHVFCPLTKPLDRNLNATDQSTLASVFTDYEIFPRPHGRVKMIKDTHAIYFGGLGCKSVSLWPDDGKHVTRDLSELQAIASSVALKLEKVVFD